MIRKLGHYLNRYRYHRTQRMLPEIAGGMAACGQDVFIHELLGHKKAGVFVDIGANDGVTISNTCYLEKEHGWTGLAIEPIPAVFEKLKRNRSCITVHGCVTPTPGKALFMEMVGGPQYAQHVGRPQYRPDRKTAAQQCQAAQCCPQRN